MGAATYRQREQLIARQVEGDQLVQVADVHLHLGQAVLAERIENLKDRQGFDKISKTLTIAET